MKNLFFLVLIVSITLSCQKESKDEISAEGLIIASGISLKFVNDTGQDLLNPILESSFDFTQMKLYYQIDGEKVEVFDTLMDSPRNLKIIEEEGSYTLRVVTNQDYKNGLSENDEIITGRSIALLELNSNITDTIETEWDFYKNSGSFFVMKIWYNGEYHDFESDTYSGYFTIVKL